MKIWEATSRLERVQLEEISSAGLTLHIKREDELHPYISGNKFRKLKYNIFEAQSQGKKSLLSFGGAYSNHIHALSYAGKRIGMQTIGVIRGDELANLEPGKLWKNPTLRFAKEQGMQFKFVSRSQYRDKENTSFIQELRSEFGDFYLVPEGGTNALAIKGCEEILNEEDVSFDYICVAVGTGGTISGLINASRQGQTVLGFPSLRGDFLREPISEYTIPGKNWSLINAYDFGGYAKIDENLIRFINKFYRSTAIPLDPVYTGKMMYGLMDLVRKNYFKPNSSILAIHTGGLQGIEGMNMQLRKKKMPELCI